MTIRKTPAERLEIERAIERSAHALKTYVWPVVRDTLGGGELVGIEAEQGIAEIYDRSFGIDAWHELPDGRHRSLASRVQYGTDWRTFTVRYSTKSGYATEYDKRMRDVNDEDAAFPALTMQAYISDDDEPHVYSAGVVRSRAFWRYIDQCVARHGSVLKAFELKRAPGGNYFFAVPWRQLARDGVEVTTVYPPRALLSKREPVITIADEPPKMPEQKRLAGF